MGSNPTSTALRAGELRRLSYYEGEYEGSNPSDATTMRRSTMVVRLKTRLSLHVRNICSFFPGTAGADERFIMQKFITILTSLAVFLGIALIGASPASAHLGCSYRMGKPTKTSNETIVATATMRCGAVYDPNPDGNRPGTRHSTHMTCAATIQIKTPRVLKKDIWTNIGSRALVHGIDYCALSPTAQLFFGRQEYRTKLAVQFNGSLGPQTKSWTTDSVAYTRYMPPR